MKQVSILWQRMSTKEKLEFQEQSRKDRERYEAERLDFIHKRQEETAVQESQLLSHSLLDSVKSRSKVI
jgi:hypothetical protein